MSRISSGPVQGGRGNLSTRRGFVASASLGAVSLYALWAGLGAAPLRFWDLGDDGMGMSGGGHAGGAGGPTPDEFRAMADAFNASRRQADGSVSVEPAPAGHSMADMPASPVAPMAGMDMSGSGDHSGHAMPDQAAQTASDDHAEALLDVFLVAEKWSFDPAVLRLKSGQPYRFRMMAVDAGHGASLQLGRASHIIRLPKGVQVEQTLSFAQPGEYLLYCTIYCGEGHQVMSGRIVVS